MTIEFDPAYKEQLQPAADSFRLGWQEAMSGQTLPLSELWQDLDDE
jgi:hypothetical protein